MMFLRKLNANNQKHASLSISHMFLILEKQKYYKGILIYFLQRLIQICS